MGTGKPLISILMAVYNPQPDWLKEQLDSLNRQTYPNLRLYIRDDASPEGAYEALCRQAEVSVTNMPYFISRSRENLGSNRTFEWLTREAEGALFAYCDQDDIWQPEKLAVLEEALSEDASMSYCDMSVIDGGGAPVAGTLRQIRPRLRYVQGSGVSEQYFFRNCTAGCSMLIRADVARGACPFLQETVHDHWLAVAAAAAGRIVFVDRALMAYRQHGGNQTGILAGVTDKESYRTVRIRPLAERLERYRQYAGPSAELTAFTEARLKGDVLQIWRYRSCSPHEAKAEIALKLLPEKIFQKCLEKIK